MKRGIKWLTCCTLLCLLMLIPKEKAGAAERLFNIIVKDGYSTQVIEMKYGQTPYGYTSYYANRAVIYVNPKAKKVTFSIKKNTSSRYGNFTFASTEMKPTTESKANLFTYTVDGKRRAWMFTVQKLMEPEVKTVKLTYAKKNGMFIPRSNRSIKIKTVIKAEVPVKTEVRVLNQAGKTVYLKKYGETQSTTYNLKWNGKPSKKNSAGLSTKEYVPAGEYRIRVITIPQTGGKRQEYYSEKKVVIGETA